MVEGGCSCLGRAPTGTFTAEPMGHSLAVTLRGHVLSSDLKQPFPRSWEVDAVLPLYRRADGGSER